MLSRRSISRRNLSFWAGAVVVGLAAVFYAKLVGWVQGVYFSNFSDHPYLITAITPLLFVIATFLVVKFAPDAKGSGIPQVLEAIELSKKNESGTKGNSLVSLNTAFVKVLSTTVGFFGGASLGREGPTVQIASSVFAWLGRRTSKMNYKADLHFFLTAGASAGVAAAFNTPLAGITFAMEELAEEDFHHFKQWVMASVIIAGITAQSFLGNYLYFGSPSVQSPNLLVLPEALVIGTLGGLFGGVFARLLDQRRIRVLPKSWWVKALVCGLLCAWINYATRGITAGSGYEATKEFFMGSSNSELPLFFVFEKLATTVLSYLSGMAGGIFSPCLSIGSGLGYLVGHLAHLGNIKVCGLIGMVAFFSGVVQAPLTAVIIVMEMTDEHVLIIPFLIAAFIAHAFSKILMPVPLYRHLAFGLAEADRDGMARADEKGLPDVL